jgi:acetyl esterase
MADPTIERAILRGVLALPRPILRLIAGGGVVYRGGRTLDPRFQYLARQSRGAPPLSSLPPVEARQAASEALSAVAGAPEPGVATEAVTIDGPGGIIDARAYRPSDQDPAAPMLVYAHMGGGVIGDLETAHVFCTILARIARCPVVSVDYRLAPEHRFPAALDDIGAAYEWALRNAERFGAPASRAAVGGDSMGGNFAAVLCQALKRRGQPQPALQLLIYPAVDVASETQSMTTYADAYPLPRPLMEWFIGHYMGPDDDPADPRLSPLKLADLSGLAPAVIATAGFDPLVDQGEAYAKRLRGAGTPVFYRCYDGLAHGFTAFTGALPAADVACREIAGLVREVMEGRLG